MDDASDRRESSSRRDGLLNHMLWTDLRHAARALHRNRGLFLAVTLTFAVGIGAATALLSIANAVLIRPLPYPEAHKIVQIYEEHPGSPLPAAGGMLSNISFHSWKQRPPATLEAIAAYSVRDAVVRLPGGAERLRVALVSPELFQILGARTTVGRLPWREDDAPAAAPRVVLSERLWRHRFGGSSQAIGSLVEIDGNGHSIAAVASSSFAFPDRHTHAWIPWQVPRPFADPKEPNVTVVSVIARLRAGVAPEQAASEGTLAATLAARGSATARLFLGSGDVAVRARPLTEQVSAGVRPALLVLTIGVLAVFVVGCANVANLLLARGVQRERQLAVCAALGATKADLVRGPMFEAALLALSGGLAAMALAATLVGVARRWVPPTFPRLDELRVDWTIVLVGSILTACAAIVVGLAPAAFTHRSVSLASLTARSHMGLGSTPSRVRLRRGLLVLEVALATVLLLVAALLSQSYLRLTEVDPGYRADAVLMATVQVPGDDEASLRRRKDTLLTIVRQLAGTPGVLAAGAGNMVPLDDRAASAAFPVVVEGESASPEPVIAQTLRYMITPGYAEALGMRLVAGRFFDDRDNVPHTERVMVNEEFARLYLPRAPAGRQIRWGTAPSPTVAEVVGIVGNVLKDGKASQPQPEFFMALADRHSFWGDIEVVIRTAGDPLAFAPEVRRLVREVAPEAAVSIAPLSEKVSASMAQRRLTTGLVALFAIVALGLTAVGVYGTFSYDMAQRQRELGLRAALGATPGMLRRLVLRDGFSLGLLGVAVGLLASLPVVSIMRGALVGVRALEPVSLFAASALVLSVIVAACVVPAGRAALSDPAAMLRTE